MTLGAFLVLFPKLWKHLKWGNIFKGSAVFQTHSDVVPGPAHEMFSSKLASCSLHNVCSDITLLSFPVADFSLGVSCLKSLSFLSIRRVFTGASPPAHTPSHPTPTACAASRLPHAPLGQGKMERVSVPAGSRRRFWGASLALGGQAALAQPEPRS